MDSPLPVEPYGDGANRQRARAEAQASFARVGARTEPARLFETGQMQDRTRVNELIDLLERRVALLSVLRAALAEPGVYVRIGHENELPAMHSLALVATAYGLAQRKLGTVSLIGPVRMDYAVAIATVREAAHELSRFVEDAYAEN